MCERITRTGFARQFLLRSFGKSCMTIARAHFEIPARVKTDPILNNYLTKTMENNARSFVRRIQAEMSFIFIFLTVVSRTALSIWKFLIFVGELLASALKPLRVWHVNKSKETKR